MQLFGGLALVGRFLIGSPFRQCATATQYCARKTREDLSGLSGSRGGRTARLIPPSHASSVFAISNLPGNCMQHVRHYSATAWCITGGPDPGTRMIPKEYK